ncbi:hypothetical protein L218DRAFT_1008229, partial [Marasmius fiardii PR-910]
MRSSTPANNSHVVPTATPVNRQEHMQNSKPKSLLAATVAEATEDDDVVYVGSRKTEPKSTLQQSEPSHYPESPRIETKESPSREWMDRVALQRIRNSDVRQHGHSNVPDQRIGFDEDSNPVDKDTTPRERWDRDFREYVRRNTSHNNRSQRNNYNNRNVRPQQGGTSGGNPGDPGGNSSDSDSNDQSRHSDNKKPPKKPERKQRRSTPWDDDSPSDSSPSEYSSDSLDSDSEFSDSDRGKGSKRAHRRKRRDRATRRYEIEKLEDYNHRRWTKKIHHKYRIQIREHVGEESPYVEGLKSVKISEPEHYKGQADVEVFEAWLLKVLRWMA